MSKILIYVSVAFWVIFATWLLSPVEPPITYLGGDTVTPEVKVRGVVSVGRTFVVNRVEQVTITRTLVKGDCKKTCETVDLPTSVILLPVGEKRHQIRDFTLPALVDAGVWRVVFVAQWSDRIGRTQSLPLKELSFKVTE